MAQVTVQQLAEVVGASSERLLTQMKEAGLPHSGVPTPWQVMLEQFPSSTPSPDTQFTPAGSVSE